MVPESEAVVLTAPTHTTDLSPTMCLGSLLTYLMTVLVGGAGSEKTKEGRAKLRKAFL